MPFFKFLCSLSTLLLDASSLFPFWFPILVPLLHHLQYPRDKILHQLIFLNPSLS